MDTLVYAFVAALPGIVLLINLGQDRPKRHPNKRQAQVNLRLRVSFR
jgi:hypothetical protein